MNKRGIVLSPPFTPLPSGGINCGGDPSPLDLRKYLLYWDEIDYPTNNLIHISSENIDYLEQTKALKRTQVIFHGLMSSGQGEFFIAAQEAALIHNLKKEPGSWVIAQVSDVPFYTEKNYGVAVDFELYGMLPVPSEDTPLADILEFKEKRRDELIAFRIHLDDIYQRIIISADIPRAKNTEISKLEASIKDLNRILDEGGIRRVIMSLRNTINMDFSGLAGVGLGAAGASSLINMSPLLAGMAGAGIVLGYKSIITPSVAKCPAQFSYLNSIRKNFYC